MSQPPNERAIRTRLKTLPPNQLIDILVSVMDDNNSAIIQAARWNGNEGRLRDGLLSESDYKIERARIVNALVSMVDDLNRKELEAAAAELSPASQPITDSPQADIQLDNVARPIVNRDSSNTRKEKIIFFLSANPTTTAKLQLIDELRMIHSSVQSHREYDFRSKEQVNWRELNGVLVDKTIRNNIYIFHFSGHGNKSGEEYEAMCRSIAWREDAEMGVVLYDDDKRGAMVIAEDVWLDFFLDAKRSCPELKVLIFNTCFSESLAKTVSKAGLYVVGVRNRVKDSAAIQFSSGFYAALVQDETLRNAVNSGCRQARPYGLKKMEDVLLYYNGEEVEV